MMMKTIINQISSIGVPIAGLLFLYVINPFNLGYLFGLALIPLLIIKKDFIIKSLDRNFMLITLLSVTYAAFYTFHAAETKGLAYIGIYSLMPPTFYLLGKYILAKQNSPKNLFYLSFFIFTLYSLPALISVLLVFFEGGFSQFKRTLPMFWDGRELSATIMGSYLTFNMCLSAILIVNLGRQKLLYNLLFGAIFVLSLISAIRLGSRTQLSIFLITTAVVIFYLMPRQSLKRNVFLFMFLGAVIAYILSTISFDLREDWLTNFADRMDSSGGDIASGGGRSERWIKSLENLFKKPLGWDKEEFGHAHNLWLDVLRAAGIIPFILLLLFTFNSLKQVRKAIRINPQWLVLNVSIFTYTIAFLLIFMVEPIFDGIFSLFVLFCLYIGMINNYTLRTTVK